MFAVSGSWVSWGCMACLPCVVANNSVIAKLILHMDGSFLGCGCEVSTNVGGRWRVYCLVCKVNVRGWRPVR